MNALSNCPTCGAEIPPDSPADSCPRCLLAAGLESDVDSISNAGATTPHTPVSGSGRRFVPPTPAELAEHFPQLEIISLVGAGGMGAVYKARQKELDRTVALKILPPQLGEDPAFAERFLREARAMARLSHPHIVAIFDFGRIGTKVSGTFSADREKRFLTPFCYFTMEFVDGTNLRQVIKTEKVESSDALSIAGQICDALQYAHEEGVIHRDIKPENILVSRLGRVKITDFGLAKVVFDAAQASALTGTAELLGTFRYMAPEQLEPSSRNKVDHRADIYALGIVLYELLTGEVPMGRFQLPSEKAQSDSRLDEIVLRALEREPERRFQRASEIKPALESIDSPIASSAGASTFTSRWTSGMFSGIWSATTSRPASAWVVGVRILGMLVAFAGLMVACFTVWQATSVDLIEQPGNWSHHSLEIARQFSLGWHTTSGQLAAIAFGLVLLHLVGNLQRLRWLNQTYVALFVCGFAVVTLSAWAMARGPKLTGDAILWEDSTWRQYVDNDASRETIPKTPRSYLESLAVESPQDADAQVESSHKDLIDTLVRQGKVALSPGRWADGPYFGLALGIGIAFVALLEFVFTYAAEPTRRLLGSASSSVAASLSGRKTLAEPRISKMAVVAALLSILPMIPFGFLLAGALERMSSPRLNYYGFGDTDSIMIAAMATAGLAVFPTTVGLFALYRIRRWHGHLHGLPLAFAASITWPLIVFDIIIVAIISAISNASEGPIVFAILLGLASNTLAFIYGWGAAKRPLDAAARV